MIDDVVQKIHQRSQIHVLQVTDNNLCTLPTISGRIMATYKHCNDILKQQRLSDGKSDNDW